MSKDTKSNLVSIDLEEIKSVYKKLIIMDVSLDEDPLRFGPKRINNKLSKARTFLSGCESIFNSVMYKLRLYEREHKRLSLLLNIRKKDLLTNDPETRAARSATDRDAVASMKLFNLIEEANRIESSIDELSSLLVVIKAKRSDLKDLMGRLRDQLKLCQEEINLGGQWGMEATISKTIFTPRKWVSEDVLEEMGISLEDLSIEEEEGQYFEEEAKEVKELGSDSSENHNDILDSLSKKMSFYEEVDGSVNNDEDFNKILNKFE
jgi:hypothetical protein